VSACVCVFESVCLSVVYTFTGCCTPSVPVPSYAKGVGYARSFRVAHVFFWVDSGSFPYVLPAFGVYYTIWEHIRTHWIDSECVPCVRVHPQSVLAERCVHTGLSEYSASF
jgi:hypothetical protein